MKVVSAMCDLEVGQVMTLQVITVMPDTSFRELVGTMIAYGIGAIPVIDLAGRPVGVVAETDLLAKVEFHNGADRPPLLAGSSCRTRWRKSSALIAAELMSVPAASVTARTSLAVAVRRLAEHGGQLYVTDDEGRLVGVLTRSDVLRLFVRGDGEIRADVMREIGDMTAGLSVRVAAGVVYLSGELAFRSVAECVANAARRVPGVIAVRNNLSYITDDLAFTGL